MTEPLPLALYGAGGRMGREVLRLARSEERLVVRWAYDPSCAGQTVEGVLIEPASALQPPGLAVVLDFSLASAVPGNLAATRQNGSAYLCAVTGIDAAALTALHEASRDIPVLHSPNLSPAMNLMFALAQKAAATLPGYTRQIIETHHTQKKDAPSGTALKLEAAVRDAVDAETPITALRMGDVVGEHRLILGGPGERLELVHRADSRAVFASGALRAALWLASQGSGFYSMADVLGI